MPFSVVDIFLNDLSISEAYLMQCLLLNRYPILSLTLTMPINGIWLISLEADTNDIALAGAIEINIGSNVLKGTIVNGSVVNGRFIAQIVGGNGCLSKIVSAKFYSNAPFILPIRETIAEAGELIYAGAASDPLFLTSIGKWIRANDTAANNLWAIVSKTDTIMHILVDGTIFIGQPKYLEFAAKPASYTLMNDFPIDNAQEYAFDNDLIVPGVSFNGKRVVRVIHSLSDKKFRSMVIYGG